MPINKKLLEILVCPLEKTPLIYDTKLNELISVKAGLAYPIKDDIPILLINESRKLTLKEKNKWQLK